jgi:tetratricopeptide (TPR) repeat protein
MVNGKVEEALEIVVNFEEKKQITPKEQLWVLLLKGWLKIINQQSEEALELGEQAYQLSQKLGAVPESIDALLIKLPNILSRDSDKALELISKAEEIFYSLPEEISDRDKNRFLSAILVMKSNHYYVRGEFDNSIELALKSLELAKKIENKISIASIYGLLSNLYGWKGERDRCLDYAMQSLNLMDEMSFQVGKASSLLGVAFAYLFLKGDLNKALEFCKRSLIIPKISKKTKVEGLHRIGVIYIYQGELDLALDSLTQSVQLAEEISYYSQLIPSLYTIGGIHLMKGDYNQAIKYYNSSLKLSQRTGSIVNRFIPIFWLFYINLEIIKDFKQATNYLKKLEISTGQTHDENALYLQAKAMMLIKKGRSRDRAEAEELLKRIVEGEIPLVNSGIIYIFSLVTLCEFLLEELKESNDPEILDELNPLIQRLLERAEHQNSYYYLADGKLLQAKLALIQLDINQAKLLLVQAQNIAEEHGIQSLARKISREHDILLEQLEEWQALKSRKGLISDRIKLASIDDVIGRLQRIRAVESPELIDEVPVLLLIIAEGGVPAFSNSFTEDWSFEDGFISNFLTAFNTFSEKVFSKGLDRAKFGDYLLVMDSIGSFSVCYLFKGQSYLAKQKIIQFAHRVQNTSSIWNALEDFHKNHQPLIASENPPLESLITEIFIEKSPEISTPI